MVVDILSYINNYSDFYNREVELEYNYSDELIQNSLQGFCYKEIDKYYITHGIRFYRLIVENILIIIFLNI